MGTKLIQRELGTLEMSSSLDGDEEEEQTGEFHFSSDQNFYRRRSDFHGLPITMMVEKKAPFLFLDSKYKGEKTFQLDKTGDEVFDVTNFINGGIYPKILKIVQENLNFSLTALKVIKK